MGIILWVIFGAIVGWLASMIMETKGGLLMDIVVGIVGAVIGGYVMSFFGDNGVQGFTLYSFLVALLGACILLGLVRLVQRA